MAKLWRDSLLIGVKEVDNQHKELFSRVDKLFEACQLGKGKDEIGNILNFLEEYVVEHFRSEEDLQLKYNYVDYVSHKAMHDAFIKEVKELKRQYEQNGETGYLVVSVNRKVIDWLIEHVGKVDRTLGVFLKDKI